MYISTEIHSFRAWGSNSEILKLLKASGFDAYDYSMVYGSNAETAEYIRKYLSKKIKKRQKNRLTF